MTHDRKDAELYDKAEELIEQKPEFGEGETYGKVDVTDVAESTEKAVPSTDGDGFDDFHEASDLIEEKPEFGEGETHDEESLPETERSPENDPASGRLDTTPIFDDEAAEDVVVSEDHEHDNPLEQIGMMPLNRPNHPLR